jgi:hypothetical protein
MAEGLMDRTELENRFRERAAAFRSDYYRFLWGAVVISVAIVVGVGLFLYFVLTYIRARFFNAAGLIPLSTFFLIYTSLFAAAGYGQYVISPARRTTDETALGLPPEVWLGAYWIFGSGMILGVCFLFPALVFHFAHELLTGRHIFASPEVERLAFEILADGGEKVSAEFLQSKLGPDPQPLRRAVRLLLEMKLLVLHKSGRERSLLRSLDGIAFVQGS